jgi:uncharacterized protein (DUF1499 family)
VNSQIPDAEHGIEAFAYQGPESFEKLAQIALSQPRTTLVKREGEYLWIEYQSSFFRFVDDLELVAVPEAGKIHVRSASRVGRSDLGVNRKRVETLRSLLGEQAVTP